MTGPKIKYYCDNGERHIRLVADEPSSIDTLSHDVSNVRYCVVISKNLYPEAVVLLAHPPHITAGSGLSSNPWGWFIHPDNWLPKQTYHHSRIHIGRLLHHQLSKQETDGGAHPGESARDGCVRHMRTW